MIPGPVYLAGDGAKLVFDTLKEENLPLRLLPEHLRQQRASGVALTAMEKHRRGRTGRRRRADAQLSASGAGRAHAAA